MKYDLLIIVQAPADLKHALSISKAHFGKKIHLCIVNVKVIYDFVKKIPLDNTKITFHPYIQLNIKNPFSYFIAKKKLSIIWKSDFKQNIYKKVYFFSRFYDWFSASIIGYLIRETNSKIFYYDHYDDASIKYINVETKLSTEFIKNKLIALIISYVSGVNFVYKYRFKPLEFNYSKYSISKITQKKIVEIDKKFLYEINENSSKVILFYLSPKELAMLTEDSKKVLIRSFLFLKKQHFILYLKGHPRTGFPKELVKFFDKIIPQSWPAEFISYENIFLTIGIFSAALSFPARLDYKVISLINILDLKENDIKNDYRNYLIQLSNNKILFESKNWLKNL